MAEIEKIILADKSVIPTDDYIFSLIGDKKFHWQRIMSYAAENYNDTGSWNFYNDGKQWLFKLVNKKKTIFWSGILTGTFRITFYFGDKVEPLLADSDLPIEGIGLIGPVQAINHQPRPYQCEQIIHLHDNPPDC